MAGVGKPRRVKRAEDAKAAAAKRNPAPSKRSKHLAEPRVLDALEEVRRANHALERRIAAEQAANPAEFTREELEARKAAREAHEKAVAIEEARAAKRAHWPLGAARKLIRDGYTIQNVMERTGWDYEWLADADTALLSFAERQERDRERLFGRGRKN